MASVPPVVLLLPVLLGERCRFVTAEWGALGRGEGVVGTRVGSGQGEGRAQLVFVEDRFQAAQRVKRL